MAKLVSVGVVVGLAGLAIAGCTSEKAGGAASAGPPIACAALMTPAEVTKACGGSAPTIAELPATDAANGPVGRDVVRRCALAVTWDGDTATRMVAVVNQFPKVARAAGATTYDRDLVVGSGPREVDPKTVVGTVKGETPANKLLGYKDTLAYSLMATGPDEAARHCSEAGLIELGGLFASRLP